MDLAHERALVAFGVLRGVHPFSTPHRLGALWRASTISVALGRLTAHPSMRAIAKWISIGAIAQLVLVVGARYLVAGRLVVGLSRMAIALTLGVAFAMSVPSSRERASIGGLIVGGASGFFGAGGAALIGDADADAVLFATSSAMMAGLAGALLAHVLRAKRFRGA